MISVCIATHNGARFVAEQLRSIMNQLHAGDEVIVSDDGSTDNTLKIISSLNDNRIHLYHYNRPATSYTGKLRDCYYIRGNFENALRHAQGDYIFLADQDDLWLPSKVDRMVSALADCDMAICDCRVADSALNVIDGSFLQGRRLTDNVWHYIARTYFLGCTMAFTKHFLEKALPFPDLPLTHDAWLLLVSTCGFRFATIREPLMIYRRHDGNVSSATRKSTNPFSFKLKYRWYMLLGHILHAKKITP